MFSIEMALADVFDGSGGAVSYGGTGMTATITGSVTGGSLSGTIAPAAGGSVVNAADHLSSGFMIRPPI